MREKRHPTSLPIPISAVVLTRNEAANLPTCLATLRWADDLLVVDSFSTDATVAVAQQHGARVVQHAFTDFASQRNAAQQYAQHDWVFFVDADEQVSAELRDEILHLARTGMLQRCNAYHIQRIHLYSGRWFPDPTRRKVTPALRRHIRRTNMARLVNRRVTRWERALHEEAQVPEPRGVLDGVIYHYSTTNLSRAYAKLNQYSDLEAALLHRTLQRQHVSILEALARGLRSFVYHYLVEGYWRYGEQGLHIAIQLGFTKYLMYAKLGERLRIARSTGIWTDADRALVQPVTPPATLPRETSDGQPTPP